MSIVQAVIDDQVLALILLVTLLAALLDLVGGVLAAVRSGTFTLGRIADFVGDHVLMRVIPIAALATFASVLSAALAGLPAGDTTSGVLSALPPTVWAAVWAAAIAYVAETLASLGVTVPVAVRGTTTKGE